jgi:hypothetical protein
MDNLRKLLQVYSELDIPPIIELQNIDHKPVGALYLKTLRYEDIVISETNNQERFYLYVNGVGIYFSYFRKINP